MPGTHARSLAKAITWRMIATTTTASIVYFMTGSWKFGLTAGAFDLVIKIFLYYLHERAWYRVKFGIK